MRGVALYAILLGIKLAKYRHVGGCDSRSRIHIVLAKMPIKRAFFGRNSAI